MIATFLVNDPDFSLGFIIFASYPPMASNKKANLCFMRKELLYWFKPGSCLWPAVLNLSVVGGKNNNSTVINNNFIYTALNQLHNNTL